MGFLELGRRNLCPGGLRSEDRRDFVSPELGRVSMDAVNSRLLAFCLG